MPGAPTRAQAVEFWPELQFHYAYDERSRLIGSFAVARSRDEEAVYQAEQGIALDHRFTDWFHGRAGYRHANATDGGPFVENRLLGEQTFRLALPAGLLVDWRTRQDFRWLDTGFSFRLRERAQIQRDVTLGEHRFTPYASAEAFYDTRHDRIARARWVAGVALPVGRHFTVEPYYAFQLDFAPRSASVHAIGLVLTTNF